VAGGQIDIRRGDLTPPQKAAALVLAIGTQQASRLLEYLDEREVEALAAEIANLRVLPTEVLQDVLEELRGEGAAREAVLHGGVEYAKELLAHWKGDRAEEIVERIVSASMATPFNFLMDVEPAELVQYLQGEHPQIIAVVLSYLPSAHAAAVLSGLEPGLRGEVAIRIASMDRVPTELIRRAEESLRKHLGSTGSQTEVSQRGGVKELANILNSADRTTERAILSSLESYSTELADQVRSLMFLFEDIVQLRDRDIQEILRSVEPQVLALAMKGVSEEVREVVLRNLSERARETLLEEIETLGAVRVRDVEEAQAKVVAVIRQLDEEGKIVMRRDGEGGLVE
jgi:flagellar motor switch protein FliG